jgi:hypothetical protein
MASYTDEPDSEYLRVYDEQTGGAIFCANASHVNNESWKQNVFGNYYVPIINVEQDVPFERMDTQSFKHDPFSNGSIEEEKCLKMLVDYACQMHIHLQKHKVVLVHCTSGRSKSPNVILAYFLLQGKDRQKSIRWLTTAFQNQRPTAASTIPGDFPNWNMFLNLTKKLENDLSTGKSWIHARMSENIGKNSQNEKKSVTSSGTDGSSFVASIQSVLDPKMLFVCPQNIKPETNLMNEDKSKGFCNRKRLADGGPSDLHPCVIGRRVKIFCNRTNKYKIGTVTSAIQDSSGSSSSSSSSSSNSSSSSSSSSSSNKDTQGLANRFVITNDDGTSYEEEKENIEVAFPVGTRVKVDWEKQGTVYDGVVVEWGGTNLWVIRYDKKLGGKKVWPTTHASHRIMLSDKPLPYHMPANIKQLVIESQDKNKRQKLSSSNSYNNSSSNGSSKGSNRNRSNSNSKMEFSLPPMTNTDEDGVTWVYDCPSHVKGDDRNVWIENQCKYTSTVQTFDNKRNRTYYSFQSDLYVGQWPSSVQLMNTLCANATNERPLQRRVDGGAQKTQSQTRINKSRVRKPRTKSRGGEDDDDDDGAFPKPKGPAAFQNMRKVKAHQKSSKNTKRSGSARIFVGKADLTKKLLNAPLTADFIKKCCSRENWKKIVRLASDQSDHFTKNITSWGNIWKKIDPNEKIFLTSYKKTSIKNKLNDHRRKYQCNSASLESSSSEEDSEEESDSDVDSEVDSDHGSGEDSGEDSEEDSEEEVHSEDDQSEYGGGNYHDDEDSITTNRIVPLVAPKLSTKRRSSSLEEFIAGGPTVDEAIAAGLISPLPVGESKEICNKRRLIRNRVSAQIHREREKLYLENLEKRVEEQSIVIERLARENQHLRQMIFHHSTSSSLSPINGQLAPLDKLARVLKQHRGGNI